MPPLDGLRWVAEKSLSWLGRGSQDEGSGPCDLQKRDSACNIPDFAEPEDNSTKKRKVVSGVEVPKKRRDSRRDEEKRLLGDYHSPADAFRIPSPGQRIIGLDGDVDGRRANTSTMMSSTKLGGGFKPRDTLNTPLHAQHATQRAQEEGMGKSVYARNGDGYTQRERGAPPAKKQRTLVRSQDLSDDPVEFSHERAAHDGDTRIKVIARNGRPITARAQATRVQRTDPPESRTKPFEGNEHKTVDRYTQSNQQKPRRRHADGNRSSQASIRASPVVLVNVHTGKTSDDAVVIDDTSQEISQSKTVPLKSSSNDSLPDPRAIRNGVKEAGQKRRRRSTDSVEYTHSEKKLAIPSPSTKTWHGQVSPQHQERQKPRRTIEQGDAAELDLREKMQRRSETSGNRHKFVRDHQAVNGRLKRRERMKADSGQSESRVNGVRDSMSSVDELAGPTNVGSVSPEKQHAQAKGQGLRSTRPLASRSASPSDLKKTQFEHTESGGPIRFSAKQTPNGNSDDDARAPIHLASFYATCCILPEGCGDVTLSFDERDLELNVHLNGQLQVLSGMRAAVRISATEAKEIQLCQGCPFIFLKGSLDQQRQSNGLTCIKLEDSSDIHWLLDRLMHITSDRIRTKAETSQVMEAIYKRKSSDIEQMYKKYKASAVANNAGVAQRAKGRGRFDAVYDDEQIGFEDDAPTHSTRRRGMEGEDILDNESRSRRGLPSSQAYEQSRFFDSSGTRRSTRQQKAVKQTTPSAPSLEPAKWTKLHWPTRWPHSVVYPSEGARRVTVDFQDLERLDEGEFLNDNVISFALRRIEENMAPEHKQSVHFFNSFFYTALTTKNGKKAFNYDAVKRWTKSKDLLACDFVVVPINIDLHWFVAIICNLPNLSRRPTAIDGDDAEHGTEAEQGVAEEEQQPPSSHLIEPSGPHEAEQSAGEASETTKGVRNLSLSDGDRTSKTMRDVEDDLETGRVDTNEPAGCSSPTRKATITAGRRSKKRGPPSYDPDKPAIITLDSFAAPHTGEVRNLKEYIATEADDKRGMAVDTGQLQGLNAKNTGIPTQSNFCDCGVYLVGYVEQFAKNPREFVTKALTRTLGQEGEFDGFDSSEKRNQIRDELLALQKVQEAEHMAKKAGKKATVQKSTAATATSPKPESKATSRAASPIRHIAMSASDGLQTQPQRQKMASRKTAEEPDASAQHNASQDKELEYVVPRALDQMPQQAVISDQQSSQQLQQELGQEEMLDETRTERAHERSTQSNNDAPNELPETFAESSRPSSQQHKPRIQEEEQAQKVSESEAAGGMLGDESDDEERLDEDDVSHGYSEDEIIDLGDEDGGRDRSAEIQDSQDRSQRRTGATGGGAQWAGVRTAFPQ